MKPLPRAATGSVVTLDADLYNFIAENLERLDKWVVQPPLNFHQTPAGNLLTLAPQTNEQVLVRIIGAETGGGRYQGSILTGNSTGIKTNIFQLLASDTNSYTDGPTPQTSGSPAQPVNNALVINLLESYVPNSHLLYIDEYYAYFALGRVMGQTTESPPRTIVYLDNQGPLTPVIAKISGSYDTSYGGVYYGRIVAGRFTSSENSYAGPMANYAAAGVPTTDNCWIVNNWEQTYIPTSGLNKLAAGTYINGLITGYPNGAFPGGSSTSDTWYMVHCWFPPQSQAVTFATTQTSQSASASYTTNEQTMLNNLKTDVTNLRSELTTLYGNLKTAGYSL